jgi:hypothetical protein
MLQRARIVLDVSKSEVIPTFHRVSGTAARPLARPTEDRCVETLALTVACLPVAMKLGYKQFVW